jgi:hypothetical protein
VKADLIIVVGRRNRHVVARQPTSTRTGRELTIDERERNVQI